MEVLPPSPQFRQWTLGNHVKRPERTDSCATTPDLLDADQLRLSTIRLSSMAITPEEKNNKVVIQERYMSSEEDLSPIEAEMDDDTLSINDEVTDYVTARSITISPSKPKKSGDLAVVMSIASVGRPKIVDLPSPTVTSRSPRLFSLTSSVPSIKPASPEPPRTSISSIASTPAASTFVRPARVASLQMLSSPRASTRSISAESEAPSLASSATNTDSSHRASTPVSILKASNPPPYRSSLASIPLTSACPALKSATSDQPLLPALPPRPKPPPFLHSDPFPSKQQPGNTEKPTHSRLRGLSRAFSFATSHKKGTESRNGILDNKIGTTPPLRPSTPSTPKSALPSRRPSTAGARTAHVTRKPVPHGVDIRTSVILPSPSHSDDASKQNRISRVPSAEERSLLPPRPKMIARGAAERAPVIELPPFPDSEEESELVIKRKRVARRKSFFGVI